MRIHIFGDMEGVAGITNWQQVLGGSSLYEEARRLYTEEINAAARGAKRAGATEIVVMDCHGAGEGWTFNSLLPEVLDIDCEYVVQHAWTEYTTFLEEGCDAALLVGMHAMAGTPKAVLCHTVSTQEWENVFFNGTRVGETGITAALCGHWHCPVVMVTGDDATCGEASALLGEGLVTATVKHGLGRFSARHMHPIRARELIEERAALALSDLQAVQPYDPGAPAEIRIDFTTPDEAEKYQNRQGVELIEPRRLLSRADDWWTAWTQFFR